MRRHVLITGTGRAGTTLLVQLLDELGLDTGAGNRAYHADARAGLETEVSDPAASYVIKRPMVDLRSEIGSGLDPRSIDAAIVPIRDLNQAALSRKVQSAASMAYKVRGGLEGTRNPFRQSAVLARRLHQFLEVAAEFEIPLYFLSYPRFALDWEYAFRRLSPVLHADEARFRAAFVRAVDESSIRTVEIEESWLLDARLLAKGALQAPLQAAAALRQRQRPG